MPFCPECQAEYREGFDRCSSCDVALVDELPEPFDISEENVQRALEGKDLVPVTRGYLDVVRESRDLLAQSRIVSLIVEDENAEKVPGMAQRVLLVVGKEDLEASALALGANFQGMMEEEGLASDRDISYDKCPACGHAVADDVEECPECGLVVGAG